MYKVMLIDDEENLQRAMRELLVSNGYEYCVAQQTGKTDSRCLLASIPICFCLT